MSLQQIKEQYAKENDFSNWNDFEYTAIHCDWCDAINEIAERHAQQRVVVLVKTLKYLVEKNPHHDGYHESKLKAIELIKQIENEK